MNLLEKIRYWFHNWEDRLPRSIQKWLSLFLLSLFLIWAYFYITTEVKSISLPVKECNSLLLISAVLLVPVNWLFESVKWKRYVDKSLKITLWISYKSILYGVALAVITPNRVGDFSGRTQWLPSECRNVASTATIFTSVAQNVFTFLFGAISLLYLRNECWSMSMFPIYLSAVGFLASLLFFIVLIQADWVIAIFLRYSKGWIQKYVNDVSSRYKTKDNLFVLSFSFARYIVFLLQFYLIINAFEEVGFIVTSSAISAMYIINTMLPSNMLVELGVRTSVVAFVLQCFEVKVELAVLSSLILWIINLAVPAVFGFIIRYRAKKEGSF